MAEQEGRDTVGQPSDRPIDIITSRDSDMGQQATVYEDTMLKLMQQQTELLHQLLEQGGKKKDIDVEPVAEAPAPNVEGKYSKEILGELRKMNERQAAPDVSKQPVPSAPATSAAAWSPLLRSHLAHIQPEVDRWRGMLDTLLVFIALFSAIVTTFFVQSLTELSQDPGDRTNELLQNLTEVIIATSGVNASHLTLPPPAPFIPQGSVVRLNFYWSIALILSISVAVLAVTSRGYVAMLTRSRHIQAHKKLGDLCRRWKEAKKLLGPAVEFLPQLLILPVVLFIVGLLDNVLSSSVPLSEPLYPIFVAGVLSCVFAVAVAMYTLWTVSHGWLHPDISPFQSTFLQLVNFRGLSIPGRIKETFVHPSNACHSRTADATAEISLETPVHSSMSRRDYSSQKPDPLLVLEPHEAEAFHETLQLTHEDDTIDQAVAAFSAVTAVCSPVLHSLSTRAPSIFLGPREIASLVYMLSDEASIRTNLTAAAFLADPVDYNNSDSSWDRRLGYSTSDTMQLLTSLMRAAERYSLSITGNIHSQVLWNHPFLEAMHVVVSSATELQNPFNREASHQLPVVYLLFSNVPEIPDPTLTAKTSLRAVLVEFLWDILSHKAQYISPQSGFQFMDGAVDYSGLFRCMGWSDYLLMLNSVPDDKYEQRLAEIMTRGLSGPYFTDATTAMHKALLRSLIQFDIEAHWLKTPHGLACVVEEYNMAFNRPKRGDTSNTMDTDTRTVVVERLTFILKEVNVALAGEVPISFVRSAGSAALQFMQISIDLALALQTFDSDARVNDDLDSYDFMHHATGSHVSDASPLCSSLCAFHADICNLLSLVRELEPAVQLNFVQWRELKDSLTTNSSVEHSQDFWNRSWTQAKHRDEVKQTVLDAFRHMCPGSVPVDSILRYEGPAAEGVQVGNTHYKVRRRSS